MRLGSCPCETVDSTLLGSRVVGIRRSLAILEDSTDRCGKVCEIIGNPLNM